MKVFGRVAAAVALVVLVGCGTPTTSSFSSAARTETPSAGAVPTASAPSTLATAGWVLYHSSVNHVSFLHPATWNPCEFADAVTVVDNPAATCPTHTEGPAGTVTIVSDVGQQIVYSTTGLETPVTVAGIPGKCFTDKLTTPPPLDFGFRTTIVCDVRTPARNYLFDFYGIPVATKPTATTQAQFDLFLQTVTFDD